MFIQSDLELIPIHYDGAGRFMASHSRMPECGHRGLFVQHLSHHYNTLINQTV